MQQHLYATPCGNCAYLNTLGNIKKEVSKLKQFIVLRKGRKLGYAEFGDLKGFPIIYCHGSQSSRLEMHYDTTFAINNRIRIITIDRPGHGISDFNSKGSILEFARDVKELTDDLRIDRFSVAGMSAGAPFALGISFLYPESVFKTAIISGFAPLSKASNKYLSKEVKLMLSMAKSSPFLLRILLRIQAKQITKNPKKALENFLKIMSEPDQKILKNDLVMKVIENMFKEAFRNGSNGVAYEISKLLVRDWNLKLDEIQVPVAFWQGEKDNNVPYQRAELMNSEIRNSKLVKYPEEGHLILFQHAEQIFKELLPNNI